MRLRQRKTERAPFVQFPTQIAHSQVQAQDSARQIQIAPEMNKRKPWQHFKRQESQSSSSNAHIERPISSPKASSILDSTTNIYVFESDLGILKSVPFPIQDISSKKWTYQDDQLLRKLVIKQYQFDWAILADRLSASRAEVIKRWQQSIYPRIKLTQKIAGARKWSFEEDTILLQSQKKFGFDWEEILTFLPSRSICSIEGRWRRLVKDQKLHQFQSCSVNKDQPIKPHFLNGYLYRKQIIKIIGAKKQFPWLSKGKLLQTEIQKCGPT